MILERVIVMVLPPPSGRAPLVAVVVVSPPIRMILAAPVRAILPPPSYGPPIMVIVEIAPPFRMMLPRPIGLILPPPSRVAQHAAVVVATPGGGRRPGPRPRSFLPPCRAPP